jgi:hypothetical protein
MEKVPVMSYEREKVLKEMEGIKNKNNYRNAHKQCEDG